MKLSRNQKIIIAVAVIIAFVIGIAYAVTSYQQSITWTYQPLTESFAVSNSDPTSLGTIIGSSVFTRIYTVTNDGNTQISIVATTSGVGFTASWDKTTVTLNPGASATFTLTLTVTGDGGCTVHIDKA